MPAAAPVHEQVSTATPFSCRHFPAIPTFRTISSKTSLVATLMQANTYPAAIQLTDNLLWNPYKFPAIPELHSPTQVNPPTNPESSPLTSCRSYEAVPSQSPSRRLPSPHRTTVPAIPKQITDAFNHSRRGAFDHAEYPRKALWLQT